MKNTITEETKRIEYKGHTIIAGWDEWGQKMVVIDGIDIDFWSISDAKKYINGEKVRIQTW